MADYSSQTVAQLKEILKERGLPVDGKKADLVARLTEADGAGSEELKDEETTEPATNGEAAGELDEPTEKTEETSTETTETPSETKEEKKSEPKKVLSPEERKQLAVDLLTKKIKRAEKFGDEASAEIARKDLARVEKFGVELGTALAREIGIVDKSFSQGLRERGFKKRKGKKSKQRH